MAQKKQEMSLEEFEDKRHGGAGRGNHQVFLRELQPLTPTQYSGSEQPATALRANVNGAWRGRTREASIISEKGGTLRTSIIGDELWVVWYPEEKNGA